MDARERLRLYLEQRRDLGESELVLDTLPVDDVLALLGARGGASGTALPPAPRARASRPVAPSSLAADASGALPPPPAAPDAGAHDAGAHDAGAHDAGAHARGARSSGDSARPDEAAPPMPPAAPTPRFDPTATTRDWRATLREQAALPERAPEPMPTLPLPDAAPRVAPAAWLTALEMPMGLQVGRSLPAVATDRSLESIATEVAACRACSLGARAINPVPGEGNPHAEFVCVGEAPGQHEDEAGRPFVGPAGQLLEKILAAIQFARNDVFICNVLKHRPPGNRTPSPDEVRACRPFLEAQLAVLRPRVILALGTSAAHALLETTQSLGSLRGQIHHYYGVPLIVTYHPSALLRNEAWKRPAWQDVQLARRVFDASRQANPS